MGNPVGHYFNGTLTRDGEDVVSRLPRGDLVWFPGVPYALEGQRTAYRVDVDLTTHEFVGHVVRVVGRKYLREAVAV